MTVLVEAVSVIIKLEAIDRVLSNGWESFREHMPNFTLCRDDHFARFCFMNKDEAMAFKDKLESLNFVYQSKEGAQDFVFIDQQHGPTIPCSWIEYGHVDLYNDPQKKVAACRLAGSQDEGVVTPDGWKYENSFTERYGLIPQEQD